MQLNKPNISTTTTSKMNLTKTRKSFVLSKILERCAHKQLSKLGIGKKDLSTLLHCLQMISGEILILQISLGWCLWTYRRRLIPCPIASYNKNLNANGITDMEHKWFTDYLFNRKQQCIYKNATSDQFSITSGVPQGLYFNDLEDHLQHSKVIKFSDDTVIYVADPSFEIVEKKLNEDLEALSKFFDENELIINFKKNKTESVLFGFSKKFKSCPGELDIRY